jgi:hypothetical protein
MFEATIKLRLDVDTKEEAISILHDVLNFGSIVPLEEVENFLELSEEKDYKIADIFWDEEDIIEL